MSTLMMSTKSAYYLAFTYMNDVLLVAQETIALNQELEMVMEMEWSGLAFDLFWLSFFCPSSVSSFFFNNTKIVVEWCPRT